ncbi:MAG TPA: T9SS type A sorting domain-containing protein [Pelobium sp.]|nr:T9SS type A sorting domain-containing protein [Pelobium sp.]
MRKSVPIFKKRYSSYKLLLLGLFLSLFQLNVFAQEFQAESGVISNGANIQDCTICGGNKLVGNLGGNSNGTLTNTITVDKEGDYLFTLYYASADPRSIYLTVNNETARKLDCMPSGGWNTVSTISIIIKLKAGSNIIKFDQPSGWGPNIDKFDVAYKDSDVVKNIPFGQGNFIEYSLGSGRYNVYFNNVKVIGDAYALAKTTTSYSSLNYTTRVYSSSSISDDFGVGTKYVISLFGNNLLPMSQIFYVYNDKPYFFTEIVLNGNKVKSNYMAPLLTADVKLPFSGDNRALFVPFDNDAFVRYNAMPLSSGVNFTSSELGAVYDNTTRNGLIMGSLEQTDWKTGIEIKGNGSQLTKLDVYAGFTSSDVTRDTRVHGFVGGNVDTVKSSKIFVGYFEDWRNGLEEYAKSNKIAQPQYIFKWDKPTPYGWNSWGVIQDKLTFDQAKGVVNFFSDDLKGFRNDSTLFIDLDSYWDNLSEAQLTQFVTLCKSKGFKPGIYWGPFVDWGKSDRKVEGSSYNYADIWTKVNGGYHDFDGARSIDPTHPGTKQRINYMIDRLKNLGFQMIKIDFIGHATVEADSFYDPNVKTGMQAFKEGMEYLINRLDGKMLVYAAISPSLASGRYVHMRRIACDSWSSIQNTSYTLNSTSYGWWQTFVYKYIDADHLVFKNESEGTNKARIASGLVTGTVITGDDFSSTGQWTDRAKTFLQNQDLLDIGKNGIAFKPVEGNTGQSASELFVREIGKYTYVAAFNYGTGARSYNIDLKRLGLYASEYKVKELFSGVMSPAKGSLKYNLASSDALIFRFEPGALKEQTINFDAIGTKTLDQKEFTVSATATSALPVTLVSSNINVAVIEGNKIVLKSTGVATITATQAGDEDWLPANNVSYVLTVAKGNQLIQFESTLSKNLNSIDYDPAAVASSGLKVTYSSSNPQVATILQGNVHVLKTGTTIITASQAGNSDWLPATAVNQTLTVADTFELPANNFKISLTDESCTDSKNGTINILATEALNYQATLIGNNLDKTYTFNNNLEISSLSNGTYNLCLTVFGNSDFSRCYELVIKAPKPLTVYSYVNKSDNKLELSLSGSSQYNIQLNGKVYQSNSEEISLDLKAGTNTLLVTTDKACQGSYTQEVFIEKGKSVYPNPFQSKLFIMMGNDYSSSAEIAVFQENGQLLYDKQHEVVNGEIIVDLHNLPNGTYLIHMKTKLNTTTSKIIKNEI